MVKLTAELIEQAAQYTNAVRDRELDLRGESGGGRWSGLPARLVAWPSPAVFVPPFRVHAPAGFLAHRLAAQLFPDEGLVQLVVAVH